ncbi:hypothetical protein FNV43_RR10006 [Rhamnella rubrinervis]|uniref:Uncharacterized protein n=1 Tax=Rhamnella rubrinervis TaxID=2594499 RepID=A0A8K0HCE3_9ROSA|nr:hypothetical protein FNV43_RR10006 [Rhamnella rubrinervis]
MEDEKKKKKNKKKKNKQNKTAEEAAVGGGGETAPVNQNHLSNGKDGHAHVSQAADVQNNVQDADVDLNRHRPNDSECSILAESEKQQWLQREAPLEETIKQLQAEKDLLIQKEATLENTNLQLQKENNLHLQKEATFEDAVKQLKDEKSSHVQKVIQDSLEMKILQLQGEKDSWLQREVELEEKIMQLVDLKTTWDLKEVSLQEKIRHLEGEKDSWILKEEMNKESMANLNDDIAKLRVQVVELVESRNNLLQENHQLVENISSLELQIEDFKNISTHRSDELTKQPSGHEDLNSQVEAACALVEKLITENAELVEKVNELYIELERQTAIARLSSTASVPDPMSPETAKTLDHASQIHENIMSIPVQELDSVESVAVNEERNSLSNLESHHAERIGLSNADSYHADVIIPKSSISDESSEIVQIPLDENDIVEDLELQVAEVDAKASVPLTDAPLIGAPFRLVSFVARYVSGADLVNKNSLDSNH